jgi:hypothetical protein
MAPPKGSHNAKQYHEAKKRETIGKIRSELIKVAKLQVSFQSTTSLARFIETAVGKSAAHLVRDNSYRIELEQALSRQPGSHKRVAPRHFRPPEVRAKQIESDLRVGNLEKENRRLKSYIERHLKQPADRVSTALTVGKPSGVPYQQAFESTAHLLRLALAKLEGIEIDYKRATITDTLARPGNQEIGGPNQARWFVEWLSKLENDD